MTAALSALRHTGELTVLLVDGLDVPGVVDPDTNTVWLDVNLSDEDLLDTMSRATLKLLRPQLVAVEQDAPAAPQSAQTIAPRPQLRLVRNETA